VVKETTFPATPHFQSIGHLDVLCLFFCHLVHLYGIHPHQAIPQDNHPIYRLWTHNVMTNVSVDAGIDANEIISRSEASRFSDSLSPALLRCLTTFNV